MNDIFRYPTVEIWTQKHGDIDIVRLVRINGELWPVKGIAFDLESDSATEMSYDEAILNAKTQLEKREAQNGEDERR